MNAPLTQILVLTPDFSTTIDGCLDCDPTQTFSNIPAGDYIVIAKLLDASYGLVCEKIETVTVGSGLVNSSRSRVATASTVGRLFNGQHTAAVATSNSKEITNTAFTSNTNASNSINVYPNPAIDELNVDLSLSLIHI